MIYTRQLSLILLFLVLNMPGFLFAEDQSETFDDIINDMEEDFRDKPERESTTLEKMEDVHDEVSEDIENLASRMDSLFVNERVIYGRNNTNLRIFTTGYYTEGEGATADVDFKVRLQLPRLKRKLQFEVDRQLEDYSTSDNTSSGNNTLINTRTTNSPQTTRAGFSLFGNIGRIQSKVTAGVEYDHGIDPYARWRLSKDFKINRRNSITNIMNFLIERKDSTSFVDSLYYDYAIRRNILFRFLNEGTYKDIDHTFQLVDSMNVFQELNDRNSLSYSAGMRWFNPFGETVFYVSEYFVGSTLRHRLYKKFVYVEGTPGVSWPKIKGFEPILLFTLRLEVIFGKI